MNGVGLQHFFPHLRQFPEIFSPQFILCSISPLFLQDFLLKPLYEESFCRPQGPRPSLTRPPRIRRKKGEREQQEEGRHPLCGRHHLMSTSQSPPRKRVRNNATNSSQQLNSGRTHFQPSSSDPNSNSNPKSKNELQPNMIDEETAGGAPTGSAGIEVRKARVAKTKNGAGRKVRASEKVGSSSSSSSSSEGEEELDLLEGCALPAAILRKVPRLGQGEGSGLSEVEGEVVRLIGQYLSSVGLKNSAAVLMAEAGCRLDQPTASLFRKHVLNGEWSGAVNSK